MGSDAIWRIAPPRSQEALAEWDDSVALDEPIVCPVDPGHQRGGPRRTPLSVWLPSLNVPDFVWTWTGECLITAGAAEILDRHRVSGYELRPATGHFRSDDAIAALELWELVVTGWGGIAPAASGVRLLAERSCAACGLLVYSSFSDPQKLVDPVGRRDGDLFIVWPYPKLILTNDRVAEIIRSAELRGADLTPLGDLTATSETATPGRLSFWMPEARAHAIGDALGIA